MQLSSNPSFVCHKRDHGIMFYAFPPLVRQILCTILLTNKFLWENNGLFALLCTPFTLLKQILLQFLHAFIFVNSCQTIYIFKCSAAMLCLIVIRNWCSEIVLFLQQCVETNEGTDKTDYFPIFKQHKKIPLAQHIVQA